jgi:hypothetical protein
MFVVHKGMFFALKPDFEVVTEGRIFNLVSGYGKLQELSNLVLSLTTRFMAGSSLNLNNPSDSI